MAGFEVVVRPVVFPNIRPAPARSLPPADDPEKGFCVIKGNGAKVVDLAYSFTWSMSKSKGTETQRRVDVARVSQMDDDGNVNKNNYVDIEVANKIWMNEGKARDTGVDPGSGFVGTERERVKENFYEPIKEKPNIEIKRRDVIKRKGEE